jgi:endonuclease YncB( thermonuclease family)
MRHTKAALALALLAAPAVARGAEGLDKTLPFIADDYARALAEARAQKLPLFIEAWAPW